MREYILIFFRIMMDYFCEHNEMCFENLWQVVIKSSVLYLVLSKGQSLKGDSTHLIAP